MAKWRIQDVGGGRQLPKWVCKPIILRIFVKKCMEVKSANVKYQSSKNGINQVILNQTLRVKVDRSR